MTNSLQLLQDAYDLLRYAHREPASDGGSANVVTCGVCAGAGNVHARELANAMQAVLNPPVRLLEVALARVLEEVSAACLDNREERKILLGALIKAVSEVYDGKVG